MERGAFRIERVALPHTQCDDKRQVLTARYQLHLPSEEELRRELEHDREVLEGALEE